MEILMRCSIRTQDGRTEYEEVPPRVVDDKLWRDEERWREDRLNRTFSHRLELTHRVIRMSVICQCVRE